MTAKAIYHLLSTNSDVTTIVDDRIYPDLSPQGVSGDYIVFQQVDTIPSNQKQRVSALDSERWQIDGYCKQELNRDKLGIAIRKALDYKTGTINGVPVDQIRFSNGNSNFGGSKFRTSQDYNIRVHR
jgi:hypothetical protein